MWWPMLSKKQTEKSPLAVALFSGGLDSILAARLVQEQGVRVECLHFVSPFFGKPDKIRHWSRIYGLSIEAVDISEDYIRMMAGWPEHGYGSVLNPCVDCKIHMIRKARAIAEERGACCIISGEVLGQRPMSQRRDTLNVIARDSLVKGLLLRPLCALHMDPTEAEKAGLIDRSKLLGFSGRGRSNQLGLAERMGIREIPTPAGGCRLTERENARAYWPVFKYVPKAVAADFYLANTGRQYWNHDRKPLWLTVGRNQGDNERIQKLARDKDLLFKVRDYPGPLALGRNLGVDWETGEVVAAAAFVASFSPKAQREAHGEEVAVVIRRGGGPGAFESVITVRPDRNPPLKWGLGEWPEVREEIRTEQKARSGAVYVDKVS